MYFVEHDATDRVDFQREKREPYLEPVPTIVDRQMHSNSYLSSFLIDHLGASSYFIE